LSNQINIINKCIFTIDSYIYIGAKISFKSFDANVVGACIDATIALNGVSGYKRKEKE